LGRRGGGKLGVGENFWVLFYTLGCEEKKKGRGETSFPPPPLDAIAPSGPGTFRY